MITDMGVSVAVSADHVDAALDGGADNLKSEIKALAEQAQVSLRGFVGGAQPRSDLHVNFSGPQDDPIQGSIYALTVAAKFDTDDLPGDCEAYRVYVLDLKERT